MTPAPDRIAFLGLGGMGGGMAHRLLDRGFRLTVFNRTAERASGLVAAGATRCETAGDAVAGAPTVLVSLADELAVETVVLRDAVPHLEPGALVIDTSTVSPAFSRAAAERIARAGGRRVEACVLGNPVQARSGGLRVLAAGDDADLDRARPVLDALGHQVVQVGPTGMAATMKLAFNLLIAAQTASLAEAVVYGQRAGLDRDLLLTAIQKSGFASMVMAFRAEIMRTRAYAPAAFRARLMAKDLRLVLAEAGALDLRLPVTECAQARFEAMVAAGDGDLDMAAVLELADPSPGQR